MSYLRRFSFTRMEQGKMFAVLGLIMALVQGGYIRRKMAGKEKRLAVMVSFFFFYSRQFVSTSHPPYSSVWMHLAKSITLVNYRQTIRGCHLPLLVCHYFSQTLMVFSTRRNCENLLTPFNFINIVRFFGETGCVSPFAIQFTSCER